jgi:hypothetical protein
MRDKDLGYNQSGDEGGIWTSYKSIEREAAPRCPCEEHAEPDSIPVDDVLAVPDVPGPLPREDGSSVDLQP